MAGGSVELLNRCLEAVMGWMRASKLELGPDKAAEGLVSQPVPEGLYSPEGAGQQLESAAGSSWPTAGDSAGDSVAHTPATAIPLQAPSGHGNPCSDYIQARLLQCAPFKRVQRCQ